MKKGNCEVEPRMDFLVSILSTLLKMRGRKLIRDQSSILAFIDRPDAAELDTYTHDFSERTSFATFSKSVAVTHSEGSGRVLAAIFFNYFPR
jgi:hypothetical protein